jgi:hypothetical protein
MGHSILQPLNNPKDEHVGETNDNILYILGVQPIGNQFGQSMFFNAYWLCPPNELLLLLLSKVRLWMHWLLKYLKARNVKHQFDNQFTLGPQYPVLLLFSKPA